MNDFVSKLTLYDILAMVIPGGAMLAAISLLFNRTITVDLDNITCLSINIIISYIVGIVLHIITNYFWKPWRNSTFLIKQAELQIKKETEESHFFREKLHFCITVMWSMLLRILRLRTEKEDKTCLDDYYNAYYYVRKNTYTNAIEVIEGQIAFLQSMMLPLILFQISPQENWAQFLINKQDVPYIKSLLGIISIASIITIYQRIQKVHYLVWSDYKYLKRLEEKEKQKTPIRIKIEPQILAAFERKA